MTNDADPARSPDQELIRSLWQEARDLVKRLEGSSVQRLAVQAGEYRIEIERGLPTLASAGSVPMAAVTAAPTADGAPEVLDNRAPVVAPLVGTFYRSNQPGSKPFVEVGDVVDKGQTIGIVEAMKIMNQIQADRRGRIAEVLLKDGDWVEFQQVLMYLEPIEG